MSKNQRVLVAVADTTAKYFMPYYGIYRTSNEKPIPVIAYHLAKDCFKSPKFVYASFPQKTKYKKVDKELKKLWDQYRS